MRLSEIPDNVKRVILATCPEEFDPDDLAELDADELAFCHYIGGTLGFVFARLELLGRPDGKPAMDDIERWADTTIELDEPLPEPVRDNRLAAPLYRGCLGWREATLRVDCDGRLPREVWTHARYEDAFIRERRFGWPVPAFRTWVKGQKYEG